MSFGATLRLLRLQSGLGLRDLARRLGVSSTYLSRIETGVDPAPTPARIENIARELRVSAPTLIQLARRISPLLNEYIEQAPEAGSLFADIALRKLSNTQLAEVHTFIERRFPTSAGKPSRAVPALGELIAEDRVIFGLRCTLMNDALQMAAGRLAANREHDAAAIAAALASRESELGSGIGAGVAIVCAALPECEEAACVITFSPALVYPAPDKQPLRVLIVFLGANGTSYFGQHLAELARLADCGLADALSQCATVAEIRRALAVLGSA
jgi:PTS system nitrogen regulatory IIA component